MMKVSSIIMFLGVLVLVLHINIVQVRSFTSTISKGARHRSPSGHHHYDDMFEYHYLNRIPLINAGNVLNLKCKQTTTIVHTSRNLHDDALPISKQQQQQQQHMHNIHTWSPQDLTKDNSNFVPIPDDDYIKKYQSNPNDLWPVEFFVIPYRRIPTPTTDTSTDTSTDTDTCSKGNHSTTTTKKTTTTQILVRKSANGTAKYGLGTGVPVTRWILSSQEKNPPTGYQIRQPKVTFDAKNFPEFPTSTTTATTNDDNDDDDNDDNHNNDNDDEISSWTYTKIDMKNDAFHNLDLDADVEIDLADVELEEYATRIRNELRKHLDEKLKEERKKNNLDSLSSSSSLSFEYSTLSLVKSIVENQNSISAIQGTLRMSGLFASCSSTKNKKHHQSRYINFQNDTGVVAVDPTKIVKSMRIYTMFPQMPNPLPLPSTPSHELQNEIVNRRHNMVQSGRNPHQDKYGRTYTHISTSNVSNTIHGIYFPIDVTTTTNLSSNSLDANSDDAADLGLDLEIPPPAFDLFGTKEIKREWVSLEDLRVLDKDGMNISTEDTKPIFISGFIVRELVKEGVISSH